MNGNHHSVLVESDAVLLGDPHPLLMNLGTPAELTPAARPGQWPVFQQVRDLVSLESFLAAYPAQVLVPLEWPVILRAHRHARRGEARELLTLDGELAREPQLKDFSAASCRVGQRQLSKLRALRDQRLVRRYLDAIAAGEARGWHTLVYGLTLAVFSLPLRQGLLNYAERTVGGFVAGAARSLNLPEHSLDAVRTAAFAPLPAALEQVLRPASAPLRIC